MLRHRRGNRVDVEDWVGVIAAEGRRFAGAARSGPLSAPVPTCPEWCVRDLVQHLGLVHLWAAGHVHAPHDEPDGPFELPDAAATFPDLAVAVEDADLVGWYLATNELLVRVLTEASPDVAAWTFLPATSPRHMWARRQASETAMHRADAESARGAVTPFEPSFAADALDEFLSGFAPRPGRITAPTPRTVDVTATDTGDRWRLRIGPEGLRVERPQDGGLGADGGRPDLAVQGSASDLYLLVWNRPPVGPIEMAGDTTIMESWRETAAIRW